MPSGKTHDKIAYLLVIPSFILTAGIMGFDTTQAIILCATVFIAQMMFGPDLDLQSVQYRRWGLLKWIWLPYQKLVAHRSRFSHGIFFGPITRMLYLLTCLLFVASLFYSLLNIDFNPSSLKEHLSYLAQDKYFQTGIIGLFIGAAIHTFTDKTFSFFKELL